MRPLARHTQMRASRGQPGQPCQHSNDEISPPQRPPSIVSCPSRLMLWTEIVVCRRQTSNVRRRQHMRGTYNLRALLGVAACTTRIRRNRLMNAHSRVASGPYARRRPSSPVDEGRIPSHPFAASHVAGCSSSCCNQRAWLDIAIQAEPALQPAFPLAPGCPRQTSLVLCGVASYHSSTVVRAGVRYLACLGNGDSCTPCRFISRRRVGPNPTR